MPYRYNYQTTTTTVQPVEHYHHREAPIVDHHLSQLQLQLQSQSHLQSQLQSQTHPVTSSSLDQHQQTYPANPVNPAQSYPVNVPAYNVETVVINVENPDIENPDIEKPDIEKPDIGNRPVFVTPSSSYDTTTTTRPRHSILLTTTKPTRHSALTTTTKARHSTLATKKPINKYDPRARQRSTTASPHDVNEVCTMFYQT
jgi:hypothetical protein